MPKITGGSCTSAATYGGQVYGNMNQQHAAVGGGNVIAMKTITGGRRRRMSRSNAFTRFKNRILHKSRKHRKSRKSRRSRRRR